MLKDNPSRTPSTPEQLWRMIRREPSGFTWNLIKNSSRYATAKYLFRQSTFTRPIHGYRMKFSLHDPGISRSLILVGDREREHRYMLERIIKPDQTILDIGANIGYYVHLELQLMKNTGHIIAIEPSPDNIRDLQHNVELNNATDNVSIIHAAVSEQDGQAELHLSELSNVHSLIPDSTYKNTGHHINVPAISLPTLHKKYPHIDLIRMDIEGYEQNVLRSLIGYNQTASFTPSILFELHPPKYHPPSFNRLLADLYDLGYQARLFASSHKDLLSQHGLNIVATIPTDGTIRYVAEHVDLPTLQALALKSRAVLLTTS